MLKRLEMLGFKSFADKTAFEFGPGITCIVGPNGSGKSNVVDAIKWVLGEQSAKSLRGKEMADVIFNGSATRRSVSFAEATVVFDNARRLLPLDADEVQFTRRVYRTGESEYLINKNSARLRDFRDLFMGTGAGTEAYSVIEQGKVDVLLAASTKERRGLFEEAAGVSKFKARKLEALRKLEHVDQNLLRVHDIIDEVEKQLRSVKLQAAKARRFKEHSERLRDLRLTIGLADYHALTGQLQEVEQRTTALSQDVITHSTRCDSIDAKLVQVQSLAEELDAQIRTLECSLTDCRQSIARLESQTAYQRAHGRDLTAQIERFRTQWTEFFAKVADLEKQVSRISGETDRFEARCVESRASVDAEAAAVEQLRGDIDARRDRVEQLKSDLMESVHAAGRLQNELAAVDSQEKTLLAQRQRLVGRCHAAAGPIAEISAQVAAMADDLATSQREQDSSRTQLATIGGEIDAARDAVQDATERVAKLRERRSGVAARIEVLEDLELRKEGLGSAVQQVLDLPQFAGNVVGIVADLIEVDVEHAACIEGALGGRTQYIVVRSQAGVLELIGQLSTRLTGPVSFLPLDRLPTPVTAGPVNAAAETAASDGDSLPPLMASGERETTSPIIARADALVRTAPELTALVTHLLGDVFVVRDLAAAVALEGTVEPHARLVTTAGDVLEPDGAITTGETDAGAGLVSRKSELRSLQEQEGALDQQIDYGGRQLAELTERLVRLENDEDLCRTRVTAAADRLAELRHTLAQRRQQLASLEQEHTVNRSEMAAIDSDLAGLAADRSAARLRLAENEQAGRGIEQLIREQDAAVDQSQAQLDARDQELTAGKIELAKADGQLAGLRQRLGSLRAELDERLRVQRETREQMDAAAQQERTCQREILAASSQLATLYLTKDRISREVGALIARRDGLRSQRQTLAGDSQSAREQLQELQSELHQRELAASDMRHQRTSLVGRIREDYELELTERYESYTPDATLDRDSVQQEVQDLRRKIAGLGNVNMEALAELEELETRATTLRSQLDDLSQSKATLDEIIRKINQDSQRMFMETLDAVRGHFGELFRKLFGGGRADILLENETDVLESGIEIVARPPGKELRSLSLLSGGEKTLTTVALLMAVFRSKPTPFCVLDEVDAALDEANIDRYATLLRDFSREAQFIMITHSKRSMTCADVLYGVTMQESGVSKRVSVRFEDVGEQGEISESAVGRDLSEPPPVTPPAAEPEAA
jgi:chromosome segregation protein